MSPSLGNLVASAASAGYTVPKETPESRNGLLWPIGAMPLDSKTQLDVPDVRDDQLEYESGGLDAVAGPTRVCVFLAPGTTMRGIARALAPVFNSATGGPITTAISANELAAALLVYNMDYLGLDPTMIQLDLQRPTWRVGLRIPLPLEIDDVSGDWVTNRAQLVDWAGDLPFLFPKVLDWDPAALPIVRPDALAGQVASRMQGRTAAQLGQDLAQNLLLDPFEPVFYAVEMLYRLRTTRAADELPCVLAAVAATSDEQVGQLAWTTAGNAVLRRFWDSLVAAQGANAGGAALTQARARVAGALRLHQDANRPGGFSRPDEWGPTVEPTELPLTPKQAVRSKPAAQDLKPRTEEDPGGLHALVLGRDLCVGNYSEYSYGKKENRVTWRGPSYVGHMSPVTFDATHAAGRAPLTDKLKAGLDVELAIYLNEGLLDACRAADAAFISTGIQQWSLHTNREFSVLLQMFKDQRPDQYDLFFGLHRIQPRPWAPDPPDPWNHSEAEATSVTAAKVANANPDYDVTARTGFPMYATLFKVLAGQEPERLPKPPTFPAKPTDDRAVFFDGYHPTDSKGNEIKNVILFKHDWSGRIRLASLCSLEYCYAQLRLAAYRFTRIQHERSGYAPPKTFKVGTSTHQLEELISSEFAAATLLDQHINVPQYLESSIKKGIDRTKGAAHDNGALTGSWRMRFAINYLGQRFTADKANRDDRILQLHDDKLDPEPDSFEGW